MPPEPPGLCSASASPERELRPEAPQLHNPRPRALGQASQGLGVVLPVLGQRNQASAQLRHGAEGMDLLERVKQASCHQTHTPSVPPKIENV